MPRLYILVAVLLFSACSNTRGMRTWTTTPTNDGFSAGSGVGQYNNMGYGTCFQYDVYGNCISFSGNNGTFHSINGGGYHQNSRGEVYDNDGQRMKQYE